MSDKSPPLEIVQFQCNMFLKELGIPGIVIFGWKESDGAFNCVYALRKMKEGQVTRSITWMLNDCISRGALAGASNKKNAAMQKHVNALFASIGAPGFILLSLQEPNGSFTTVYATKKLRIEIMLRGVLWTLQRYLEKKAH